MNTHQAMDARFSAEDAAIDAARNAEFEAAMTKAVADDYALGVDHGMWDAFNDWPVSARAACVGAR